MLGRIKVLSDAYQVVRPVLVCVVAMAVVACAMAIKGWHTSSLVLGGVIVVIAAVLVFQVHRAVGRLRRQSVDTEEAARLAEGHYVTALRRIVRFVEAREQYTRGHSERVGALAERIARELTLPEETCRLLKAAGELHDIGMLAISDKLLKSRSHLTAAAFRTVKKHAEISYGVLKPLQALKDVLPAIRHHHERMNGTGYPKGLRGEQIPLGARILAVADSYDAMTHDRPHRGAMNPVDALAELRRCTPAGYDPDCVGAIEAVFGMQPPAPAPETLCAAARA